MYCEKCQRDETDYCYRCKHGYYGSDDEEQNKRYDLSEYYRPIEIENEFIEQKE